MCEFLCLRNVDIQKNEIKTVFLNRIKQLKQNTQILILQLKSVNVILTFSQNRLTSFHLSFWFVLELSFLGC